MENMFENSMLYTEFDEELLIEFQAQNDLMEQLYQVGANEIEQEYILGNCLLRIDFPNEHYPTDDSSDILANSTRLSLLYIADNNEYLILSVEFEEEDVEDIGIEHAKECLLICLKCILFENWDNVDYIMQVIPYFWNARIMSLNTIALSGNFVPSDPLFTQMYNQVMDDFDQEGWDVIFAHFNDDIRIFSGDVGTFEFRSFIDRLQRDAFWQLGNNIWLWACNAGYTTEKYPAVAYEIAKRYSIEVKAAPGTIILEESDPNNEYLQTQMQYYIVDLHDTRWESVDPATLEKRDNKRYRRYVYRHQLPRDVEWLYFRSER